MGGHWRCSEAVRCLHRPQQIHCPLGANIRNPLIAGSTAAPLGQHSLANHWLLAPVISLGKPRAATDVQRCVATVVMVGPCCDSCDPPACDGWVRCVWARCMWSACRCPMWQTLSHVGFCAEGRDGFSAIPRLVNSREGVQSGQLTRELVLCGVIRPTRLTAFLSFLAYNTYVDSRNLSSQDITHLTRVTSVHHPHHSQAPVVTGDNAAPCQEHATLVFARVTLSVWHCTCCDHEGAGVTRLVQQPALYVRWPWEDLLMELARVCTCPGV